MMRLSVAELYNPFWRAEQPKKRSRNGCFIVAFEQKIYYRQSSSYQLLKRREENDKLLKRLIVVTDFEKKKTKINRW